MSSVSKTYSDEERAICYTCPDAGLQKSIEVSGRTTVVNCRNYTKKGVIFEQRLVAQSNELFDMNLIAVVDNGVDSSVFEFTPKWGFKVQSRGGGGKDKRDCGLDFQEIEYNPYTKNGYTELLYVNHKTCQNSFIGTELQDLVFTEDAHAQGYDTDNAYSDAVILTARETLQRGVMYNDIIGVFGGANPDANSYDGILAQAYWAYTQTAYFMSEKFTVDETVFVTGTYLHAKYSGKQINILFDSGQASDASLNRYQTRAEAYAALVDWLNYTVLTENGRRYVDASFNLNEIIATSRFAEMDVNLLMFVDGNATVEDWTKCSVSLGVDVELLQNNMSVDERPFLVKYRNYSVDTMLVDLATDIHNATIDIPKKAVVAGQEKALFIDEKLWSNYLFALATKASTATMGDLRDTFGANIYTLTALENTGLWFVTMVAANENARNIAHLVDNNARANYISIHLSPDCRDVTWIYEQLHGVMVRDFRLFASNLLCSPFVENLVAPYEKTLKVLPCYDQRVRERFIDPVNQANGCVLDAKFVITDEYQNGAVYALPNGSGGYDIFALEAGEVAPVGALPVFEVQIMDTSTGIPTGETANYSYVFQFDDGTEMTSTARNPIIQFVNESAGVTFNVIQTVNTTNCEDTFVASQAYGEDFPFSIEGTCANVDVIVNGTLFRSDVYTLTGSAWDDNITVYVGGVADTIDMTGATSPATAAAIIEAWFTTNGYIGTASGDATVLTVTSEQVIFFEDAANVIFANDILVTLSDGTVWDAADGIETVSIDVDSTIFTALPVNGESTTFTNSDVAAISGEIVSKLGCTFELPAIAVDAFDDNPGLYYQNFQLTN